MELDIIALISDLGGIGLAGLIIVIGWRIGKKGLQLIEEKLVPLATNHLEHMEQAFFGLEKALEHLNETQTNILKTLTKDE